MPALSADTDYLQLGVPAEYVIPQLPQSTTAHFERGAQSPEKETTRAYGNIS